MLSHLFFLVTYCTLVIMGEKFIVEFGSSKDADREELIGKLTADERTKVVKRFDHAIFSGVVIETGNHNLDTLRALPNHQKSHAEKFGSDYAGAVMGNAPWEKFGLIAGVVCECLCQILDEVVEYSEESDTNLRDAVRLMRVCKLFETEVMGAISRTRLLRRMRKNREATILHQRAQTTAGRASADYKLTENGDASAFLARYIYQQPYQHLPWNTNLSSVINSLADKLMQQDGKDPTRKRRFSYVHGLCLYAIHPQPSLANITTRYGIWTLFHPYFQSALFPSKSTITKDTIDSLLLVAKIYLRRSDVDNMILSKILTHGPKALSSYQHIATGESSDHAERKKLSRKKPLLGSLLEAAIRSGNQNLAALLVKYEIDMSRGKSYKAPDGSKKKIKKYYDTYFCRMALKSLLYETLFGDGGIRRTGRSIEE
ncbi:hypothetical protein CFRS1_v013909 [Colletotrichum fructicola]|nr:hypothetical protein CFRS1_v013909 [Colletotrichum fructicola]